MDERLTCERLRQRGPGTLRMQAGDELERRRLSLLAGQQVDDGAAQQRRVAQAGRARSGRRTSGRLLRAATPTGAPTAASPESGPAADRGCSPRSLAGNTAP